MDRSPSGELIGFLTRFPPEVAGVYLIARDKVLGHAPEATEIVTNVSYTVSCAFTFTHSIKHAFVYVASYKKHVNLGFCDGASLDDPQQRLKGDGKAMRHLSFSTVESLDDPYADEMILRAIHAAHRPPEALSPKTVITKMKPSAP